MKKLISQIVKLLIFIVLIIIVGIVILQWDVIKTKYDLVTHTEEIYGKIRFNGDIIAIHKIRRGGRTYGVMCIKIDSSNIKGINIFDNSTCLKIQDGIATIPTGPLVDLRNDHIKFILKATHIAVNMDDSHKMIYYDQDGNSFSTELDYSNNNLREMDMNICNSSKTNSNK